MVTDREPDIIDYLLGFLEAVSTPTPNKNKETPVTDETGIDAQPVATISWQMYTAFVDAGFSEKQAFDFIVEFVKHMIPVPDASA